MQPTDGGSLDNNPCTDTLPESQSHPIEDGRLSSSARFRSVAVISKWTAEAESGAGARTIPVEQDSRPLKIYQNINTQ